MATATNALKTARPGPSKESLQPRDAAEGFGPQSVPPRDANDRARMTLRMYTEQQVAEMLQVSLSKLRKWRMKSNHKKEQGPPFRKIGRLVRYPEWGLLSYINGE